MSIGNPLGVNGFWRVDPDNRQDRSNGEVITRMMTEEEMEKYGVVKEDIMSKKLEVDESRMLEICRELGTGKEAAEAIACEFNLTRQRAFGLITNRGIKKRIQAETEEKLKVVDDLLKNRPDIIGSLQKEINIAVEVDEMMELVPDRKGDFVGTFTGLHFWPLDPRPEEICLEDIAHALSNICRFNGHTIRFYSVAEHSLNVENLLEQQGCNSIVRLYGLLHDAAEAYCCDIPRPLKRSLFGYAEIESRIMKAIYKAFGLSEPNEFQRQLIDLADDYMLTVESMKLMANTDSWRLAKTGKDEALPVWDDVCESYMSEVKHLLEEMKVIIGLKNQ